VPGFVGLRDLLDLVDLVGLVDLEDLDHLCNYREGILIPSRLISYISAYMLNFGFNLKL
jgi:hypothetical protein